MSTFPLAFKIVRNGGVEEVRIDGRPELVRLRTELELIRQYGRAADRPVVEALQAIAAETGGDDVQELLTILQDAMNPLVEAAIARIDRESPGVRREMPEQIIASEAGKFRSDVAACIRRSTRPDAAALADAYLRRSQLEPQDIEMPAETGAAAARVIDPVGRPIPQEEHNTMSTNASDSQKTDLEALGRDIDDAIDSSARAAADDNVEAVLKAAVEAADQLEVNDTNDEVDQFLDDALAELDAVEKSSETSDVPAPPATGPARAGEEIVDVDAVIAAVEEADQLTVSDTNEEVAELLSEALEQAEQGSAPAQGDPREADVDRAGITSAVEQADQQIVRDTNDEIQSVLSNALEEANAPQPPAEGAGEDAPVDIEAFAAAIEEADKQDVHDLNEDLDHFLAQALEEVDAIAAPAPEASPVSGPEQLEQIARGEPRPQAEQCTDVAQTVEAAIDEVESHLEQVASQVNVGAGEVTATAVPTASVDLEASPSADDVLAGVEDGVTSLVSAVGQPPAPEEAAPTPAAKVNAPPSPADTREAPVPDAGDIAEAPSVRTASMPPTVPENANASASPAAAAQPPAETKKPAEAAPTSPAAESPAPAPEPAPTASAAPETDAEEVTAKTIPAAAVDDIERGVGQLARFLSGEVLQLWTQARQATQEAQAFRNESRRIHAEAGRMLEEVQAMQQEIAKAREQTQGDRQEVNNLRDDIRKTLERVRQCEGNAANAADAAQAEARNAAAFAQQARQSQQPKQ